MKNVMHGGASRGGDNAETARPSGQWLFMSGIKKSFELKLFLQQLKLPLKVTSARRLHMLNDQLIVAAPLIQTHLAAHQHFLTRLGLKAHQHIAVAEHGAAHLGAAVF